MSTSGLNDQGLPPGYTFRPDWEVTPRQVEQMLAEGSDLAFIDCRTPGEFATAKINGTQLIPLQEMPQRLEELSDVLEGKKVVIHCHHGGRSLQAAMLLKNAGVTDVTSLAGGIDLWSIDIDPSIPRY